MNRFDCQRALTLISLSIALLSGCATPVSVPEIAFDDAVPAVAAQYRTEVREHGKTVHTTDWRIWREAERVERENLQEQTGEIWQRDGASLFHTQLYHADKRGIEYQPGDLRMSGLTSRWSQHAWIVNPDLLRHLNVESSREKDGMTLRRYKGIYGDAQWDITLRLDAMLPQRIERKQGARIERIELRELHALAQAPWQPTSSRDYGCIDFADLGDHERDPFVIRLQSLGAAHAHSH
jgi:hypothetical protein